MAQHPDPATQARSGGIVVENDQLVLSLYIAEIHVRRIDGDWQIVLRTALGREFAVPGTRDPSMDKVVEVQEAIAQGVRDRMDQLDREGFFDKEPGNPFDLN